MISTDHLDANEHTIGDTDHINEAGLLDSMTVAWRPLQSVVAVQQRLAPKLGGITFAGVAPGGRLGGASANRPA
jgi:hypothetical protein